MKFHFLDASVKVIDPQNVPLNPVCIAEVTKYEGQEQCISGLFLLVAF